MISDINIKDKLPNTGQSIFSKMSALSTQYDAINLAQGFPEEDGPEELLHAIGKAAKNGFNQYAPMPGLLELRTAIANKWESEYQINLSLEENIQVTAGATQALFTTLQALIHPGDEVIVFTPAYDSFIPGIKLAGGKEVAVPLSSEDFSPDWEAFEAAISVHTKAVIVNTPHNPSGRCFTCDDWQKLIQLTEDKGIFIISDEVYEPLVFDGKQHLSVLHFPEIKDRSIASFSFGKAFNITGWKVGYLLGSNEILKAVRKVHQYQLFSVNTPAQKAIADFMNNGGNSLAFKKDYQLKRDYFSAELEKIGFEVLPCEASYFLLAKYDQLSEKGDVEFCEWLTEEIGVGAVPTSVFYSPHFDQKLIRFCFAKKQSTLEKAIERLWKLSK